MFLFGIFGCLPLCVVSQSGIMLPINAANARQSVVMSHSERRQKQGSLYFYLNTHTITVNYESNKIYFQ